jgi:hypothetical protein
MSHNSRKRVNAGGTKDWHVFGVRENMLSVSLGKGRNRVALRDINAGLSAWKERKEECPLSNEWKGMRQILRDG